MHGGDTGARGEGGSVGDKPSDHGCGAAGPGEFRDTLEDVGEDRSTREDEGGFGEEVGIAGVVGGEEGVGRRIATAEIFGESERDELFNVWREEGSHGVKLRPWR